MRRQWFRLESAIIDVRPKLRRVKRPDGSAIAGLYAAGDITGGLEGGGAIGYVGGLIRACVFGFRVAEHAAGRRG